MLSARYSFTLRAPLLGHTSHHENAPSEDLDDHRQECGVSTTVGRSKWEHRRSTAAKIDPASCQETLRRVPVKAEYYNTRQNGGYLPDTFVVDPGR